MITKERFDKVDYIFEKALKVPLKPDEITFNTIIKGCCIQKNMEMSRKYLNKMVEFDL